MSDLLKFRVWYKPNECYIDINDSDVFYIEPNGRLTIGVYDGDVDDMRYLREEDTIVERCTGLKDKNGELIYEGDILATSNTNQNNNLDTWDKNALGYTAVIWDNELGCFIGSNWTWEKIGYGSVYDMKFIEVVGNIHENADLLEEKSEKPILQEEQNGNN